MREQLEQLARLKEPEARSKLIRALVGEYARSDGAEPTEVERELFSKIVLSVFEQLDRGARYELVVRLAKTNRISSELADRLAREEFELSEPVIECSPVISQEALLEIARRGGDDKRASVAHRPDLSEKITDTLIARSARGVVHNLLRNANAPFSVRATLALLIFANTEVEVLAGIAKRAMTDTAFHETQMQILSTNCPLLPPPLKKALEDNDLELLAARITGIDRNENIEIDGVVYSRHEASIQIANGELSFDDILTTLLEQKRFDAAIWLISRKVNLGDEVVADTIRSNADAAIMMLLLQTGISEQTYKTFLKARSAWLDRSTRNIPELVMRFKAERKHRNKVKIPLEAG